MNIRVLTLAAAGMAALICAPAIAQDAPPPGQAAAMQPIPNPPEASGMSHGRMDRHDRRHAKRHARKMAKRMAKAEAGAAPPETAVPQ